MVRLVLCIFLDIDRVSTDLFVVLLESGEVLASLGEFAFFHTLSDVPVNESTLGVHEVELVVQSAPSGRDGSGIGQHAQATTDLGEVTTGDVRGGLAADTEFESSRAPIYDLDRLPSFDGGNRRLYVLWNHIATVK